MEPTPIPAPLILSPAIIAAVVEDYGDWTDHRIPEDRGDWHKLTRHFYEYWLAIAPPGRLPGRQHIVPEDIGPLLPRMWLLDVFRQPLRFRCRLAGTAMVRSLGREVTGAWLDDVHPKSVSDPCSRNRFRAIAEAGCPTWRRGPPRWVRDPDYHFVESCIVPLAADGLTVDKVLGISVVFDATGKEI